MMKQNITGNDKAYYCPVYDKVIDVDLCYESMMCLSGFFKVSSLYELTKIEDIDNAKKLCEQCVYSKA